MIISLKNNCNLQVNSSINLGNNYKDPETWVQDECQSAVGKFASGYSMTTIQQLLKDEDIIRSY